MYKKLFRYLVLSLSLAVVAVNAAHAQTDKEEMWPVIKEMYFEEKVILSDADDWLILEAPKRAEDAAVVPVTVKSLRPQTESSYIKNIHVVIDNNPDPYSANFHLSPNMKDVDLTFRMRFQQYTNVRAIAEMNDGTMHMVSRFVKASGGCSAPAQKDPEVVMARLGKMQIRMRTPEIDTITPAQVIISHPNYSGLQFDQKTRQYLPAHFVETMSVTYADQLLFNVDMGISFSEDPSVRFSFVPQNNGALKAVVKDSKKTLFSVIKEL